MYQNESKSTSLPEPAPKAAPKNDRKKSLAVIQDAAKLARQLEAQMNKVKRGELRSGVQRRHFNSQTVSTTFHATRSAPHSLRQVRGPGSLVASLLSAAKQSSFELW